MTRGNADLTQPGHASAPASLPLTVYLSNEPDADFGRPLLPLQTPEQASLFDEGDPREQEQSLVGAVEQLDEAISQLMAELKYHADSNHRLARAIEALHTPTSPIAGEGGTHP